MGLLWGFCSGPAKSRLERGDAGRPTHYWTAASPYRKGNMHRRIIMLLSVIAALLFVVNASAKIPEVITGHCTGGYVNITWIDNSTAQANPGGFSCGGDPITGWWYSWSLGSTSGTQGGIGPSQTVSVTAGPCDIDLGCATGGQASTSSTNPYTGGGGPGGGGCAPNCPPPPPPPPASDKDQDGIPDNQDNCPSKYNPDQADADHNGIGNACQTTFVPISGTVGYADDMGSDTAYHVCLPGSLQRCVSDASAQPNEMCQALHDYTHAVVPGINWTVFHQRIDFTACWIPGSHFTRIKGTPGVVDLTCGSVCTYPYRTTLKNGPSINFPDYQTMTVTVQWDFQVCPIFVGIACTGDSPTFTETHYIYGEPPGVPPATGTLTQSIFQKSHSLSWGG